jgi:MFS family permease
MLLTLVIALRGDRIGRRRLLTAGAALMILAALVPAVHGHPFVLVLIGLTGMVAVTSNESTGLHSVDQAILPQTVGERDRTSVFALYSIVAFAATAVGSISVGPLTALGSAAGLTGADRFAITFLVYAGAGIAAALLASRLDPAAEVGERVERGFAIRRSRSIVARLSALFAVDSFAGGLVVQSFLAYWFAQRFALDAGSIGLLFAAGSVLGAASFPIAAWLGNRFGLIRTMVFTHIPGSMLLIAMALVPDEAAPLAAVLYLGRSLLSSMDVPTRQSYVMAVVDPSERTATAGVTSLARSASQSVAPLVAGALLLPLGLGAPLIACGALKIAYDVALFSLFRARPAPGERGADGVRPSAGAAR